MEAVNYLKFFLLKNVGFKECFVLIKAAKFKFMRLFLLFLEGKKRLFEGFTD